MLTLTALIVVPGLVICLAGGVRFGYALAGAIPVSYGVVAVASYLLGMLELRWNLLSYIVASIITAAVVGIIGAFASGRVRFTRRRWFLRFGRRDRARGPEGGGRRRKGRTKGRHKAAPATAAADTAQSSRSSASSRSARADADTAPELRGWRVWVWNCAPFLGVIVAAWIIASLVINLLHYAPDGLSNVFQGWDAHWHANYLRFIADTGLASPDDAGLLQNQETQAPMYYPSAWHALAALVYNATGASVVETYNLVQIGAAAIAFPLGVASITWVMTARFPRAIASTATTAAALMTALFPGLPFIEFRVAATPSALSAGLVGAAVLMIVAAVRRPAWILPAGIALLGVGGIHPSGFVTSALFVLFWWFFEVLWRPINSRLKDFVSLGAIAVIGVLVLIPQLLSISADADSIAAFEFETGRLRWETWIDAIAIQVRHVRDFGVQGIVLGAAVVGLLFLLRRGIVWIIAFWALYIAVGVNTMVPFGNVVGALLHPLGSIYYNDPRRVGVVLATVVAAIAALGVASVAQGLVTLLGKLVDPLTDPQRRGASSMRFAALIAVIITTTVWSAYTAPKFASRSATEQRYDKLVDEHDRAAFDWLAQQPKAYDGRIFTNANEGSGWMYALNGLPSLSRHYSDPSFMDTATNQLLETMDLAGSLSWTDRALSELGITYVYESPPPAWGFQPFKRALLDAYNAPGLALVYADRQVRIYAVRAQFTQNQIDTMIDNSPFPPTSLQAFTRESEEPGYLDRQAPGVAIGRPSAPAPAADGSVAGGAQSPGAEQATQNAANAAASLSSQAADTPTP